MTHKQRYWREKQKRAKQSLHGLARKVRMYGEFGLTPGRSLTLQLDHAADAAMRATRGFERAAEAA